jgi:hypothetical protein
MFSHPIVQTPPLTDRAAIPYVLQLRHRTIPTAVRMIILMLAGAAPVSSIPLCILGWLPMTYAAMFVVIPLTLATALLIWHGSPEAQWAKRGIVAGLAAVFAYDAVRMPLVWSNIWPDFIPRMGGWVTGVQNHNALVGYTWRYLGDGAGIGMSFFLFCGTLMTLRPQLVTQRPILFSVGYGIFIWGGLIATVALPARGQEMLFRLTPTTLLLSLLGHLIYGSMLGLYLRAAAGADAQEFVAPVVNLRSPHVATIDSEILVVNPAAAAG